MANTKVIKTKAQQYQQGIRQRVDLNSPAWARSVKNGRATDRTKLIEHAVELNLPFERSDLERKSIEDLNKIVGDALLSNEK